MKLCKLFFFTFLLAILVLSGCQQKEPESYTKKEKVSEAGKKMAGSQINETNTTNRNADFKAEDKIVTINGKILDFRDFQFQQMISKVEIELHKDKDNQKLKGSERLDKLGYWDEQLHYHDNFNVILSKMIEQHAMYLLAKEKRLSIERRTVEDTVNLFKDNAHQSRAASKLMADFPEGNSEERFNAYFSEKLLSERIFQTLKADVQKEKPKASEKEISFETSKRYEELYQSQVSSLDLKIYALGKK